MKIIPSMNKYILYVTGNLYHTFVFFFFFAIVVIFFCHGENNTQSKQN